MKYSIAAGLIQATLVLAHLQPVYLKAPTTAHFRDIVRNTTYDFGCRAVAHPTDDGQFKLHALLTEAQISYLTKEYNSVPEITLHREDLTKRQNGAPIGSGDRFKNGTVAPVGVGTQSGAKISSIMNVNEINSAIEALVNTYGIGTVSLPYTTFEGASSTAGFVGTGTDKSKYHLYLSAGVHARERGGPDQLIYWISDLLSAKKSGKGLTYGKKTYTNAQVNTVLNAGIVFFPLVNPDGVAYDQQSGSLWRKNRNTASGSDGDSIGVDINRNFDFMWDYTKYFDPSQSPASNNPSDETFYGTSAFSEPESSNLASIYDSFKNIRWFMDIHSAVGDILYSWGDDDDQTSDPNMNFLNSQYDGQRGNTGDTEYKEYIPSTDLSNIQNVAGKTVAAMKAAGGRSYVAKPAVGLYPTSGASVSKSPTLTIIEYETNTILGRLLLFEVLGQEGCQQSLWIYHGVRIRNEFLSHLERIQQ